MCVAVLFKHNHSKCSKQFYKETIDHYIEFVNKNTKRMLPIMATWLTGMRQLLIFTKNLKGELMRSVKKFNTKGQLRGKAVEDDQGF